jgi:hypothetical protein
MADSSEKKGEASTPVGQNAKVYELVCELSLWFTTLSRQNYSAKASNADDSFLDSCLMADPLNSDGLGSFHGQWATIAHTIA